MSKLYKSSRVVLDDEVFVLSSKIDLIKNVDPHEIPGESSENEAVDSSELADEIIEAAQNESDMILQEADKEASRIERVAQESSDKIVADAYDQAKGIMEKAQEEGYQTGYQKGLDDSQASANKIIEEALGIRTAWHEEREKLIKEAESEVVSLVLEITEKVLHKKLETDEALIEGLVKSAIENLNRISHLVLRVSPEDYNHAISIKPMILAMTEKIDDIEVRQDSNLENGSCIIDTDAGSIDNSLWTQYEQIKQVFEDLLKSE